MSWKALAFPIKKPNHTPNQNKVSPKHKNLGSLTLIIIYFSRFKKILQVVVLCAK